MAADEEGRPTPVSMVLAVGPSGADVSVTRGRTWEPLRTPWRGLHTFSQARGAGRGFSAGGGGGIASVELRAAVVGLSDARL